MTSKPLKKLAADSNVILSAVIGKAALRVFTHTGLEIITTQFNFEEVLEYVPRLAAKYRLSQEALLIQLNMLPMEKLGELYYKDKVAEANKFLKNRDQDDVHLAALALKENIPIWSNDKDFQVLPHPLYTTSQLLKYLE